MKTCILYSVSAVSLLLCVGAAFLLARSRGRSDSLDAYGASNSLGFYSSRGQLVVAWTRVDRGNGTFNRTTDELGNPSPLFQSYRVGTGGGPNMCDFFAYCWPRMLNLNATAPIHNWNGFEYTRVSGRLGTQFASDAVSFTPVGMPVISFVAVGVSFWSLVALFLALPAMGLILTCRKRARRNAGHCAFCGYDLRATPERCPECGTIP